MPELTRVANSRQVTEVGAVFLQKFEQQRGRLTREAEHDLLLDLPFSSVPSDAAQNRKARVYRLIDRQEIPPFHVRDDPLFGGCQVNQVPLHMAFRTQCQV